jgi:hypothetical protein
MGLPEAITRVAGVHEKEQHLAAPREVVANHLGFKSLNGSSLKALSSLLKYGLLEKVQGDQRRVTDLAVRILHPTDEADKRAAIIEAANHPALFKEIANNWPNGSPSDENLKAWLIRRHFAADAVNDVIKAYRDTMDLVAREAGANNSPLKKSGAPTAIPTAPQERAIQRVDVLPAPPSTTDPYYFNFKPSVGFEGGFRLKTLADFERLISTLNAFKTLHMPVDSFGPPGDAGDDDERPI